MNGWQVPVAAANNNFVSASSGCETSRAEIVIPVASKMRQMTVEPTHNSLSGDVYFLMPGELWASLLSEDSGHGRQWEA